MEASSTRSGHWSDRGYRRARRQLTKSVAGSCRLEAASVLTGRVADWAWKRIRYRERMRSLETEGLGPVRHPLNGRRQSLWENPECGSSLKRKSSGT